jgi:hypothetical protein
MGLTMSKQVTGCYYLEVEIGLSGTFSPGYPASPPSYASGGEPGQADGINDLAISGISVLSTTYHADGTKYGRKEERRIDLTEGVDLKNPEVQKLFANILKHFGEQCEEALLAEVGDDGDREPEADLFA